MGISRRKIKKWFLMLTGRSVFHVKQNIGKHFSTTQLNGYFNSLIEKVTRQPQFLTKGAMPTYKNSKGDDFIFPVAVIQYGLGCYDLFLETNDTKYLDKTVECDDWILSIQNENGGIPNFTDEHADEPYGAMCQGEAASLLLRCFKETKSPVYLKKAKKALDFMLTSVDKGGTSVYEQGNLILLEVTFDKPVLNGWIFAFFGLYDFVIITGGEYLEVYKLALSSLIKFLPLFDHKYWSMYDLSGRIASPFYHRLHIAQLEALYMISKNDVVKAFLTKWRKRNKNPFIRIRAFIKKAFQKIKD